MKNYLAKMVRMAMTGALAGLLSLGAYTPAFAAAVSLSATEKARTPKLANGLPVPLEQVGAQQFELYFTATATQVTDNAGNTPTSGLLLSVEVSTASSGSQCYLDVFDTASPTGLSEGSSGRQLIPPVVNDSNRVLFVEFRWPKQFNKGLAVKLNNGACRATIGWTPNGGAK